MELAVALSAEGRRIDDAACAALQGARLEFERHERGTGERRLKRLRQRGREAEPWVVVLVAEDNDRLPTASARPFEAGTHQGAADALTLAVRLDRHRRQGQRAHGFAVNGDIESTEQDVAIHQRIGGNQLNGNESRSAQCFDQLGFVGATKCRVV